MVQERLAEENHRIFNTFPHFPIFDIENLFKIFKIDGLFRFQFIVCFITFRHVSLLFVAAVQVKMLDRFGQVQLEMPLGFPQVMPL